jgi:DNA-binding Xre family transcriptional regulator
MKTKINELCRAAGIATAYQLQKKTDLSPSQAARLYKDEVEAISLSVLEKLCNTLKCSPNDIFGYNEPQTVKPQLPKPDAGKPAKPPQTLETTASSKGMTTEQVAQRLEPIAGKILSKKRITECINKGILKSTQHGKRSPHLISEADYLAFEPLYRQSKKL